MSNPDAAGFAALRERSEPLRKRVSLFVRAAARGQQRTLDPILSGTLRDNALGSKRRRFSNAALACQNWRCMNTRNRGFAEASGRLKNTTCQSVEEARRMLVSLTTFCCDACRFNNTVYMFLSKSSSVADLPSVLISR